MTDEYEEDPNPPTSVKIGAVIFGSIQIVILIALGLIVLRSCQWGP